MITNPTPQRKLRSHRPERPHPRALASAEHHAWLTRHLTARDRWLARMCFEHKVLTSHQIIETTFPSRRAANLRLRDLHAWGVLARFQPHRSAGSHPMHYVLDTAGAHLLAHEDGLDPRELRFRREREIGRAYSLQLAHTVGTNGLFTRLIHRARQPSTNSQLTAWWSATRCAQHWSDILTPDAYGRWREHGRDAEFFLEFDFGTETLAQLAAKLPRYEQLATATGITTPILIWLPTAAREATARRALTETLRGIDRPQRVPVATTSGQTTADPHDLAEARWQPLASHPPNRRVRLADIPTLWPHLPPPIPTNPPAVAPTNGPHSRPELTPPTPMPPPAQPRT